jgi:hypothetical protein
LRRRRIDVLISSAVSAWDEGFVGTWTRTGDPGLCAYRYDQSIHGVLNLVDTLRGSGVFIRLWRVVNVNGL